MALDGGVGVLAPLLGLVLGTMSTILNWGTTAPLSHPGEPAGFAGAVIQFVGLVVALGAGIVAVTQAPRIRAYGSSGSTEATTDGR